MAQFARSTYRYLALFSSLMILIGLALYFLGFFETKKTNSLESKQSLHFQPRRKIDSSGLVTVFTKMPKWAGTITSDELASLWRDVGHRLIHDLDSQREVAKIDGGLKRVKLIDNFLDQASLFNYEGEPRKAYAVLEELRSLIQDDPNLKIDLLYTVVFFQGVTALRRGETENCVHCIGESSCILPISPTAIHSIPTGSNLAIQHFTEYLEQFPEDLEVRWLLNIAHMTLGEYPAKVDPKYFISLEHFDQTEHGIGKFRDVGHLLGINRLNWAGGAIMDDFDNDGLLDLVFTSWDPCQAMVFYRNKGDGTFEDRTSSAGLEKQLGGANSVQADFNNDGFLDILIMRGGWSHSPMHMSLLRNDGSGKFTDVTQSAGLYDPINTMAALWGDYDNDGFLDLFVCCENQPNRLYRNRGDGTFEDVASKAGVAGKRGSCCKGGTWIDFDNDQYCDLFITDLNGTATLYKNNRNSTFTNVTVDMGIDGPTSGFSCWSWDFDNDGWPDIFATSFDRTLGDVVLGLTGKSHRRFSNKLFRNLKGKGFQDITAQVSLDSVFSTMGSNFGDFDNDGFLDMYLGTGDPNLSMLVPNRMFRNLGGKRFAEITASSGTGHLQKGHGIACGDWDRDGNIDIAIEMGGAVPGDKYHNLLFQNPGQGNNSINVKLNGKKTNRSAIGASIRITTSGSHPLTVHRYVTSGSSFGANPLEQTLGVGKADQIATLEVYWPTSRTIQTFFDVNVNQFIEITEFENTYSKRPLKSIPLPK